MMREILSVPPLCLLIIHHCIAQKTAAERNELPRSVFIAEIGSCYVPEQFIFIDESAKDQRTLSRRYGYLYVLNTRARSKVIFVGESDTPVRMIGKFRRNTFGQ